MNNIARDQNYLTKGDRVILLVLLLYILLLVAYLYYARRSVDKAIPTKAQEDKQNEHLKRLRKDRIVGDFVLTPAVIPAMENDIVPEEGYRIFQNDGYFKINGGCLIIASVSAEKMKEVVLALMSRIGTVVSISFEDHHSDENNIIDYLSYDREYFMLENIIDSYWRLIESSYDIQMAVFAGDSKIEIVLTRIKTIHIHVVDASPFTVVLQECGLTEKADLRFFTTGAYYYYNDYAGTDAFQRLISDLEVNEKRFYEKSQVTR